DEDRTHNFAVAVDEAMTNAIRYATGAEVSISAESGAWVAAEVRDRGRGIPAGTSAELPPPGAVTGRGSVAHVEPVRPGRHRHRIVGHRRPAPHACQERLSVRPRTTAAVSRARSRARRRRPGPARCLASRT